MPTFARSRFVWLAAVCTYACVGTTAALSNAQTSGPTATEVARVEYEAAVQARRDARHVDSAGHFAAAYLAQPHPTVLMRAGQAVKHAYHAERRADDTRLANIAYFIAMKHAAGASRSELLAIAESAGGTGTALDVACPIECTVTVDGAPRELNESPRLFHRLYISPGNRTITATWSQATTRSRRLEAVIDGHATWSVPR